MHTLGRLSSLMILVLSIFSGRLLWAAPVALKVWTQPVAYKVQPTTAPGKGHSVVLEGAKDSYEAAQIIIHASGRDLSTVTVSASALRDDAGHTISASHITFFKQHFIDFTKVDVLGGNKPVPKHSPTDDGKLPDPLVPLVDPYSGKPVGTPFNVASGLNQPVWMDVYIPKSTAAGKYTGKVTVSAKGQPSVTVPVSLTVWSFVLPDSRTVTTRFTLHTSPIIDYHRGTYDCSGSNCWLSWNQRARTIVKRYEEMAHEHRCDTQFNFVPDPSNGCLPPKDWKPFDDAVKPYLSGSYWNNKVPSNWMGTPFSPGVDYGPEGSCSESQYTALAKSWAQHLKSKGWFNRTVVYAMDEPNPAYYPDIAKHSKWMQSGDPDWKAHIMDTTQPNPSNVKTLNPALGIYCVALCRYDKWWSYDSDHPYGRAQWKNLFSQGIKLWFYESNAQGPPYPTFATNTLLGMEPVMMMWGAWYERATGFLYWDMTYYDEGKPWGPAVAFAKTGDGVLVYPGNHDGMKSPVGSPLHVKIDGPVPSYRLKMIRLGLQDWALFVLAEQRGLASYARSQIAKVYGQLGGCTWNGCPAPVNGEFFWKSDNELMRQVRHNIALAIMKKTASQD